MFKPLIIYLTIGFMLNSCSKSFLDVPTTQRVAADEYIIDPIRASEFLNGIYFQIGRDLNSAEVTLRADLAADNLIAFGTLLENYYTHNLIADIGVRNGENLNRFWLDSYDIIRQCNFLLESIGKFSVDTLAELSWMQGQLLVLRAYIHHQLLLHFCQPYNFTTDASHPGIPYDTTYEVEQQISRTRASDVYNQIIADMSRGVTLLKSFPKTQSKINIVSATALLIRVHFYKEDYQAVVNLSKEVINDINLISSADFPTNLYTDQDTETLFWLPPAQTVNDGGSTYQGFYLSFPSLFAASQDIVNLIGKYPTDSRNSWFTDASGNWQVTKFPIGAVDGVSIPQLAYYHSVIRGAEVYLMLSESLARTSDFGNSIMYLNIIRERANLPIITASPLFEDLLDSITVERRKELCFENTRLFDIMRLKQKVTRIDYRSPAPSEIPYGDSRLVAPLPLNDVELFRLNQNPGY